MIVKTSHIRPTIGSRSKPTSTKTSTNDTIA